MHEHFSPFLYSRLYNHNNDTIVMPQHHSSQQQHLSQIFHPQSHPQMVYPPYVATIDSGRGYHDYHETQTTVLSNIPDHRPTDDNVIEGGGGITGDDHGHEHANIPGEGDDDGDTLPSSPQ